MATPELLRKSIILGNFLFEYKYSIVFVSVSSSNDGECPNLICIESESKCYPSITSIDSF